MQFLCSFISCPYFTICFAIRKIRHKVPVQIKSSMKVTSSSFRKGIWNNYWCQYNNHNKKQQNLRTKMNVIKLTTDIELFLLQPTLLYPLYSIVQTWFKHWPTATVNLIIIYSFIWWKNIIYHIKRYCPFLLILLWTAVWSHNSYWTMATIQDDKNAVLWPRLQKTTAELGPVVTSTG